jgi:hypothetical protein
MYCYLSCATVCGAASGIYPFPIASFVHTDESNSETYAPPIQLARRNVLVWSYHKRESFRRRSSERFPIQSRLAMGQA